MVARIEIHEQASKVRAAPVKLRNFLDLGMNDATAGQSVVKTQ